MNRTTRWISLLYSLLLHATLLLGIAWALSQHVAPLRESVGDRQVGVSLVKRDTLVTQYVDGSAGDAASDAAASSEDLIVPRISGVGEVARLPVTPSSTGAATTPTLALPSLAELGQSGAARGGFSGRPARTSVFGVTAEGSRFVYVFDRSGSMSSHGGRPLAAAKAELLRSLDDLAAVHQFQVIFYNEEPKLFRPRGGTAALLWADPTNKQHAHEFVMDIQGVGGTRHLEAIRKALHMGPDVVFFLTDADEPRLTRRELDQIHRVNRGAQIHAIEFGYGARQRQQNFLTTLAHENGGQHVYLDMSRPVSALP